MNTFDYAAAWREVAKPAYEALPQSVRDLLAQVATEAAHLGQKPDLSMPWPDDPQLGDKGTPGSNLRVRFDKTPAEILALAARVIHAAGHWFPSRGELEIPGRNSGSHWKFAHYADQSLRERLIAATSADTMRNNGPFQVHEGAIRFCYSSPDTWMWHEVAPATVKGLERAREISNELSAAFSTLPSRNGRNTRTDREARDNAAYLFMEALKTRAPQQFPEEWRAIMDTSVYMRDEQEIKARDLERVTPEEKRAAVLRRAKEETDRATSDIRKIERRRDAMLWCIESGIDTDNAIYYDHENGGAGVLCFGWREKVIDSVRDRILGVISECPFAYRIKCADGKVLEGGIG